MSARVEIGLRSDAATDGSWALDAFVALDSTLDVERLKTAWHKKHAKDYVAELALSLGAVIIASRCVGA